MPPPPYMSWARHSSAPITFLDLGLGGIWGGVVWGHGVGWGGWVMKGWGWVMKGWGGVGWGVSYRGGVGWVMKGWGRVGWVVWVM